VLDLYRWDRALYTDVLLPKDILATMFAPAARTSDIPGFSYGFGFYVRHGSAGSWEWHDGGIDGFQAYYGRRPDRQLCVIVLTNREDIGGYNGLDQSIADLVPDR